MTTVVDLYAGAGGWDVAAEALGMDVTGVENDDACAQTREAAGFTTIHDDIRNLDPIVADGLIASPPCFPAGTPVLTTRGLITIENVVEGDLVLTHRNRWRPVVNTMSRDAEVIAHSWLATTADHPFWTRPQIRGYRNRNRVWSLGDPDWTPATKVHGEFIATPVEVEPLPVPVPEGWTLNTGRAFWTVVGRWLADGWVRDQGNKHEVIFGIGKHKADDFRRVLQETGATAWEADMRTSRRFTFHHLHLPQWLVEHFGYKSYGKTLPGWLFGAPQEIRQAVLDGYLAGDGYRDKHGWSASTTSFRLAVGLRLLAVGLGYTSTVIESKRSRSNTVIEGRSVNERLNYRVQIAENDGRYTRTINGHQWTKSRKPLAPRSTERVYDITVADDESFTAYGYVVHNCPTFSAAGRGSGRRNLDQVLDIAHRLILDEDWWTMAKNEIEDDRTALVLEPLHWVFEMRKAGTPYRWIAMEQVPPVLPIWEYFADLLRWMGYSAKAQIAHSEQFGVPQTRKRAILIASLDHDVVMPEATHSKYYPRDPGRLDPDVLPWVSMAEALGWGMTAQPSTTVVTGNNGGGPDPMSSGSGGRETHRRAQQNGDWVDREVEVVGFPRLADTPSNQAGDGVVEIDGVRYRSRDLRPTDRPAQHLTEKARSWQRWQLRQSALKNATVRDAGQPAPTITAAHDSGERIWMLSAGRTSPQTTGSRPRSGDESSPTMMARNVAIWLVNNTSANAGVREARQPAPTLYFGDRLNKAVWTNRRPHSQRRDSGPETDWANERPATTITTTRRSKEGGLVGYSTDQLWPDERPSTTVNGDPRISKPGHHDENTSGSQQAGAIRVTPEEAAILQSFPAGFPFQGTKTSTFRQIGNAVPPLLALHVLAAATGQRLEIHVEQEDEATPGTRRSDSGIVTGDGP